jgi:hypothetical protein
LRNATITLQALRSGAHFTYRIQASDPEKSAQTGYFPCHFVKILDGPPHFLNAPAGSSHSPWVRIGSFEANEQSADVKLLDSALTRRNFPPFTSIRTITSPSILCERASRGCGGRECQPIKRYFPHYHAVNPLRVTCPIP